MTTENVSAVLASDEDPDDTAVLEDMAAELDHEAADPDDRDPDPDDAGHDTDVSRVAGVCRNGPYHGRTVSSRFPKGFLLVDKTTDTAYLYDRDGTVFVCRVPEGAPLDQDGRWRAAEEGSYDVLAFEPDPDALREVHP